MGVCWLVGKESGGVGAIWVYVGGGGRSPPRQVVDCDESQKRRNFGSDYGTCARPAAAFSEGQSERAIDFLSACRSTPAAAALLLLSLPVDRVCGSHR